jgi:hypothetical protein
MRPQDRSRGDLLPNKPAFSPFRTTIRFLRLYGHRSGDARATFLSLLRLEVGR